MGLGESHYKFGRRGREYYMSSLSLKIRVTMFIMMVA